MAWRVVNTVSIGASDLKVRVGSVEIPTTDSLEVRVRQVSPVETSVFRFGLIYLTTGNGRTYGSRRFWGHREGEDYVLGGHGYSAGSRYGELWIEPRGINRSILKHGVIGSSWVLEVSADEGATLPSDREQAPGFVTTADRLLSLIRIGQRGRVRF